VDRLLATKSEGVGLIVRAISFQDFQPMCSQITNVTDRQTDGRHAIPRPRICTKVHCAVKTNGAFKKKSPNLRHRWTNFTKLCIRHGLWPSLSNPAYIYVVCAPLDYCCSDGDARPSRTQAAGRRQAGTGTLSSGAPSTGARYN